MNIGIIYLVFFFSGISGLIYQVVWVRNFGNIFGNTIYSSALVTAVFMFGLGAGSYLAGRFADRRHRDRALKYYATSEILIGLMGLLIAFVLPHLEVWSASVSSYRMGEHGWYELSVASYLFRYFFAVVLLVPITLLMGGTLTLLIRFIVEDLSHSGWKTGLLYGLNTAGAACGCLLVDFVLIPKLGLLSSQQIAALINLSVGLIVWLWFRNIKGTLTEVAQPKRSSIGPEVRRIVFAVFLTGFAGMGMEIVWFRFLTSALGQLRSVFSLLLFVILVCMWLGSTVSGYLSLRIKNSRVLFIVSQGLFVLFTLFAFSQFDMNDVLPAHFGKVYFEHDVSLRPLYELWYIVWAVARLIGLPAFFMGFGFPLANAIVQKSENDVGRRAGTLYLGNTAGAVVGSLCIGFLALPIGGMKWSAFLCCLVALASVLPLGILSELKKRQMPSTVAFMLPVLAGLICLVQWSTLSPEALIIKSFRARPAEDRFMKPPFLIDMSEGTTESIVILRLPDDEGGKRLYTNGHSMSASYPGAQRYMRAMVHIPLLNTDAPKSTLVICFGVGNTLNAASLYSTMKKLDIVDLSKHILAHAPFFSDSNGDVLNDPRVSVYVNDGRQHLRMNRSEKYDLVTLEPPPLSFSGVAALYSEEFYKLAKENLKASGFITQWLPIRQLPGPVSKALIRAFLNVFPNGALLAGEYGEFILIGKREGPMEFDPEKASRNLELNPRVKEDLERIKFSSLVDLAGAFLADSETLLHSVEKTDPITDDTPFMEYVRVLFLNSHTPTDIIDVSRLKNWCPKCSSIEGLGNYSKVLQSFYTDAGFSTILPFLSGPPNLEKVSLSAENFKKTLGDNPYLQRLVGRFNVTHTKFLGPQ